MIQWIFGNLISGSSVFSKSSLYTWNFSDHVLLKPSLKDFEHYFCLHVLLFSHSVMSSSLWPHGWQHARLPCPSPSPGACSNSCALSRWCHPTISYSVIPFSSCLQSFPASGSFPMNWPYTSWGQSIWASASASVLPMNIQSWFPLGMTGLISM